ncbi:FRG domain-containing protein [Tunicatimonas pelagia]|uniref:FRG domain-containing protein n=1 Tax=Tunicatimonas pelagia TaxID=931531 RepID=UPI002666D2B3|nr:FRG domain-containing protein [Tunicatimonas pelagia]WKN44525.1 FRG domain-containing protein [Tunicatimonas pelagia]
MATWPHTKIERWTDFTRFIDSINTESSYLSHWAFRGQSNSSWTLKPSISRLLESHCIEQELGNKFEQTVFREFISKAHLYEDFGVRHFESGNTFVTFTIMQHYGCPTRLLDWTTSPYIALYFAVNSSFSSDGAVYLFNQTALNDANKNERFDNGDEIFSNDEESDHIQTFMTAFATKRLNSQQGIFSIGANIDKDHEELIYKSLINKNTIGQSFFAKLIINKKLKVEFLAKLRTMNVRADQLYPDIYGFSSSLKDLLEIRGWEKKLS